MVWMVYSYQIKTKETGISSDKLLCIFFLPEGCCGGITKATHLTYYIITAALPPELKTCALLS